LDGRGFLVYRDSGISHDGLPGVGWACPSVSATARTDPLARP
jgi:hypothetical protein